MAQLTPPKETPYLSARRNHNEAVHSLVSSRLTWQVIAIMALNALLLSIGGLIYLGQKSHVVPYVVAIKPNGDICAIGTAKQASLSEGLKQKLIKSTIARFIEYSRIVTPDTTVLNRNLKRLEALVTKDGTVWQKLRQYLRDEETSPYKRAAQVIIDVKHIAITPKGDNLWEVEWQEVILPRKSGDKKLLKFRASVTTHQNQEHATQEQIYENPMGIYIQNYSWTQLL